MNEMDGSGLLPEIENIICQLERGTVVTKFFQKKHPDRRILSVKRETRQVVWCKPMSKRNVYEGAGKTFVSLCIKLYIPVKLKT
jgi:phosphatidylinositol phospholipase C gamma-1